MKNAMTRPRGSGRSLNRHESSPFRVCTAQDFDGPPMPKRKAGPFNLACQLCRTRKIKCMIGDGEGDVGRSASRMACEPCRQAGLQCKWENTDGRKRRKQRAVNTPPSSHPDVSRRSQSLQSSARIEQNPSPAATKRIDLASRETPIFSPQGSYVPDTYRDASQNVRDIAHDVTNPTPELVDVLPTRTTSQIPGLTSIFEAQIDTSQLQGEPFFAEFYPNEDTDLSQEWPDLQNFVLGLDFPGGSDDGFQMPDHASPLTAAARKVNGHKPPQKPRTIRLRYYRRFGPTAIVPGLRKLSVVVDPHEDTPAPGTDNPDTEPTTSLWDGSSPASVNSQYSKLFDGAAGVPRSDIIPHILENFFERFGGHFPFHHPQILGGHVRSGEASSFLLNAIAALTLRFCGTDGPLAIIQGKTDAPWQRGTPFLKKAKEQLVPLLSIPAPEVVAGLIILAWAEFGDNNEAGLWMFAGMAIRMVQDLGFHRTTETNPGDNLYFHDQARPSLDGKYILTNEQSAIHQQKARLVMFWSVFILDVCVSLGTGRPPSIRRSEIEVSVPTFADMKQVQLDFSDKITIGNMIFPETVRFMLLFSEAVEALNERLTNRNLEGAGNPTGQEREARLGEIRDTMLQSYRALPSELTFNIDNYRNASASGQSGLFLMLHLFFYTFMTLLSDDRSRDARQGLHQARSRRPSASNIFQNARQTNQNNTNNHRTHLEGMAVVSCQKTVQILTTAQLVDQNGYLATPFINHCLFVAASTILQQHGSNTSINFEEPRDSLLSLITDTDYEFLCQKLRDQGRFFASINSVVAVLDQKRRSLVDGNNYKHHDQMDQDEEDDDALERIVGVTDPGIVNRYTIPR